MTDRPKPKVFLGMPRYSSVEFGAALGFFCPTRGGVEVWNIGSGQNSLTPNAFNDLLLNAMNFRDAGQITHFAMIHADVEAPSGWLDTLWEEMVSHELDMVSAVIPIKSNLYPGRTSTAVGHPTDPWLVHSHIYQSDRPLLPTTFTIEDMDVSDHKEPLPLLVNTGLWLADLRHPAWDTFPGFTIHCRIIKDEEGKRIAQCRPEDWELSRHLHACGARVGATWAVQLEHRGTATWKNY